MATKKVHTSAVALIPPQWAWPQIQTIRKEHDRAYDRWMPHINLVYPFVPVDDFADAAQIISNEVKQLSPFTLHLKQFNYFTQRDRVTMHITPEEEDGGITQLRALQQLASAGFPHCTEQHTKSKDGFSPHMTVGQYAKKDAVSTQKELTTQFSGVEWKASEIALISRSGQDTPFQVIYTVELGTGNVIKGGHE
eukprot:GFYU01020071.1.p1 GENE.GFYU01020071.1~~GFYU01020071.1.p1  ORF type:complete len:222 (+),score=35.38 GFYU01020071.1:85-666(+)